MKMEDGSAKIEATAEETKGSCIECALLLSTNFSSVGFTRLAHKRRGPIEQNEWV